MSAILDALGYLGDSLDKPGRAVRGLLGGRPEEAMAAIPFSDTMGLTNQANRVSGSDLLRQLGMDPGDGLGGTLAGMGVEMATDPLTWAGVGLGGLLGKRAGAAAIARGPQYETGLSDLSRMITAAEVEGAGHLPTTAVRRGGDIYNNPQAARALSELHPDSRILGGGAEGLAFLQPDNSVVRIGRSAVDAPGRPIADTMLGTMRPPVDIQYHPNGSALRAERLPFADSVGSKTYWDSPAGPGQQDRLAQLMDDSQANGLWFADVKPENAGRVAGRNVVIDPGAVDTKDFTGAFERVGRASEPGPLMNRLLDLLGSNDSLRAGLTPSYTGRLAATGGAGGATLGGFGRLNLE